MMLNKSEYLKSKNENFYIFVEGNDDSMFWSSLINKFNYKNIYVISCGGTNMIKCIIDVVYLIKEEELKHEKIIDSIKKDNFISNEDKETILKRIKSIKNNFIAVFDYDEQGVRYKNDIATYQMNGKYGFLNFVECITLKSLNVPINVRQSNGNIEIEDLTYDFYLHCKNIGLFKKSYLFSNNYKIAENCFFNLLNMMKKFSNNEQTTIKKMSVSAEMALGGVVDGNKPFKYREWPQIRSRYLK